MTCAQRLVRRICPHCKESVVAPKSLLERLRLKPKPGEEVVFYRGLGCDRCKKTGFMGRASLIEVLPVTDKVRHLIVNDANAHAIKKVALEDGIKTLRMVGIEKAREGLTSLEEVFRVTSADE